MPDRPLWISMLYTQLRSFHAVAREGSAVKASRVLNVSQPTITTQIKELEARHGLELFRRHGRRLELTDLGRQLLSITQRFFDVEGEVTGFLEAAQDLVHGHLRVGAVGPYPLMKFLMHYREKFPDVTVSVDLGNSDEILKGLRDQRTDIGIVSQIKPDPDIAITPFGRQSVVAFVSVHHPWSTRDSIRLAELDGQVMVMREEASMTRRVVETALAEQQVQPTVVMEVGSREAVWEAVAEGHGIGVISEISLQPDPRIKVLPISDYQIQTRIDAVCLKQRQHSSVVRAFLEMVANVDSERFGFTKEAPTSD
ncbi:MAG: LysR family transcriptional regulator [Rhodospirillaceae bacterium]|nr:LysR family transcriptional regulator [Rhodospirillaceae bacterium]